MLIIGAFNDVFKTEVHRNVFRPVFFSALPVWLAGRYFATMGTYLLRLKHARVLQQWLVLHQVSLPADTPRNRNLCKVKLSFEVICVLINAV